MVYCRKPHTFVVPTKSVVVEGSKSVCKTTAPKGFCCTSLLGDSDRRVLHHLRDVRPRIFPRERLVCFRYRVFGRHLVAHVGIEPRLQGMNLMSYHCSTSAIYYKAHYVAFSIPKTDASNELLSVPFCINIISKFSKKVKFSGRSGEN